MFLYLGATPVREKRRAYGTLNHLFSLNFGGRVGDVTGDGIDDFCIWREWIYRSLSYGNNLYIMGSEPPLPI
ncbi:MAG: hypothetical protein IPN18_15830 [Ignavibacteriales bacterium]|nr:hypothetical protein [Ignavibacteriales bacterium]